MVIEFSSQGETPNEKPKIERLLPPEDANEPKKGIAFRNEETGQEFLIAVYDKFPQMGEMHLEGRHYVEVSVEMFMELLRAQGFEAVVPEGATPPEPEADQDGEDA